MDGLTVAPDSATTVAGPRPRRVVKYKGVADKLLRELERSEQERDALGKQVRSQQLAIDGQLAEIGRLEAKLDARVDDAIVLHSRLQRTTWVAIALMLCVALQSVLVVVK